MGTVFKARDLSNGQAVALKFPFFELESDPAFYSRFQRELQIGQTLQHPGVIKMLAVDRPSRPYVAMEYLDGETLHDLLGRRRPLPVADALRVAIMICDALEHMHQNSVVHRDLKPTNIMICRDGSVRIMDFGIAMSAAARRLTLGGLTGRLGTPAYMAPEQVRGQRGDNRTDIYGLGAILYEMATGHPPFDEQPDLYSVMNARVVGDPVAPRMHNQEISVQVEEIILHAMERDPHRRYQTADDMRLDLVVPEHVQLVGRVGRLETPRLRARHWRVVQTVVVALLFPVILFFVLLLILKR